MANELFAKTLTAVSHTQNGEMCRIDCRLRNGQEGALLFPFDQLEPLFGLLLQVERELPAQSEDSLPGKRVLRADNVGVSIDRNTQDILFEFHVAKMQFAFALPREHAVNLMAVMKTKLPSH